MSRSGCAIEHMAGNPVAQLAWCSACGSFHLSIGFIQISLTLEQFTHLHLLINHAMQAVAQRRERPQDEIHASPTMKRGLH